MACWSDKLNLCMGLFEDSRVQQAPSASTPRAEKTVGVQAESATVRMMLIMESCYLSGALLSVCLLLHRHLA